MNPLLNSKRQETQTRTTHEFTIDDRAPNVASSPASQAIKPVPCDVKHRRRSCTHRIRERCLRCRCTFRHGRFISGKTRPFLVQLHSAWDHRRLVIGRVTHAQREGRIRETRVHFSWRTGGCAKSSRDGLSPVPGSSQGPGGSCA